LESVESSNQHQITQVLGLIQRTVGFRVARGLLQRPVYREFFAAGLTVLDPIEGFESVAVPARLEVQNLIREIGLIDEAGLEDEAFHEIEPGTSGQSKELDAMIANQPMTAEQAGTSAPRRA
jgi:hypothetical protein